MPELPEVEVLVRHLHPALARQSVRQVTVMRPKVVRPSAPSDLERLLPGAVFQRVERRGKYLLFTLRKRRRTLLLLGHLGMTGRMFLQPVAQPLPRHAAVVLDLTGARFIFQDTRYFGRMTLDLEALVRLGPEPLSAQFTPAYLAGKLARSGQAIKIKLLDQSLVAGLGNIYASEALFRAGIRPQRPANKLAPGELRALHRSIRTVLREAIRFGSTVPLDWAGTGNQDGLFYYGQQRTRSRRTYTERLRVYDRRGLPCRECERPITRLVQGARSTYFCANCQH